MKLREGLVAEAAFIKGKCTIKLIKLHPTYLIATMITFEDKGVNRMDHVRV